jgi:hypothetical protein
VWSSGTIRRPALRRRERVFAIDFNEYRDAVVAYLAADAIRRANLLANDLGPYNPDPVVGDHAGCLFRPGRLG